MSEDSSYPRTHYEARLEVAYKARLHARHECLFDRLDKWGKLLELLAGSGAFFAVTAGHDTGVKVCALMVTAIALAGLLFDFAGRARDARSAMQRYMQLLAKADKLNLAAIDQKMAMLSAEAPKVVGGLRNVAYNDVVSAEGRYSYRRKLSVRERFLQAIA